MSALVRSALYDRRADSAHRKQTHSLVRTSVQLRPRLSTAARPYQERFIDRPTEQILCNGCSHLLSWQLSQLDKSLNWAGPLERRANTANGTNNNGNNTLPLIR